MNYLDFYKTDSPIVKMQRGGQFSYDPKDSASILKFQKAAAKRGYYDEEPDGRDGPKTKRALQEMNQNGGMRRISVDQAKDMYVNGHMNDGMWSAAGDAIQHVLRPSSWNLGTNNGARQQAAAIIANKGIPASGKGVLSYADYGKMTGQSSNPNEQSAENNAAGKTIGMATYRLSPDGKKVIVEDSYDFHTLRIPEYDQNGNIIEWKAVEEKGYLPGGSKREEAGWKTAFKGALQDIRNGMLSEDYDPSWSVRLQHFGENFGTRQGKTRDSSFEIPISDINRWTR